MTRPDQGLSLSLSRSRGREEERPWERGCDLHKCAIELDFHLFADDTNIFLQDQNLQCLELKLNEELDKVNQWLQLNRLSLHIDKTNFVIFHLPHRKILSFNLKISAMPVEQSTYVKYLGLIVDCPLNCKKTCS